MRRPSRGHRWSAPIRPTPLATLGGRSTQRHHGVDDVPTPERTVDPTAISEGAPESLRSRPQLENSAWRAHPLEVGQGQHFIWPTYSVQVVKAKRDQRLI